VEQQSFFLPDSIRLMKGSIPMDKKTKTQVSLVLLIIGLIMLFIPYLKYFDSIVPGISQSFNLMFYLGLVLIVIGYYLK
jgi:hypothetical protein